MAKYSSSQLQSIHSITKYTGKGKSLPVYFLCGTDTFAIDQCVKYLKDAFKDEVASDFDIESYSCEDGILLTDVLDSANAFPFGDGKKLIILKNLNKLKDKKPLADYIKSPSERTILVITYYDKVTAQKTEPFKSLIEKNYLFEAGVLKGRELIEWVTKFAARHKLQISFENAKVLVDFVGEDKNLLELQLEKFSNFLGEGKEITLDVINNLSSLTKEYSVFDLQDSIAKADKSKALEIGLSLLKNTNDLPFIVSVLTKFFLTISYIVEMEKRRVPQSERASQIGASPFYIKKCSEARFFLNEQRLKMAVEALLEMDLANKTSQSEPKSLFVSFIAKIFS